MDSTRGSSVVAPRATQLHPPTATQALLYKVVRTLVVVFCRVFWRMEIHGLENVPVGRPFILSAVHRSNIDSLVVAGVTSRRLRYLGKDSMWKFALPGRFFSAMGGIPVHRGEADRDALKALQTALEQGEPVVVFPEGQRRTGPVVEDIFDGPAFVASRTGAPILPVGIGGSERAMPPGAKSIRPVKVVLVIGEPIPAPVSADGGRVSRSQIRETTATLRSTIQALFDDAQARAGVR